MAHGCQPVRMNNIELPPVADGLVSEPVLRKTILPVSRPTVQAMRSDGRLPYVQIGKRILYHPPTVLAALLRLQRGATA